jgi:hypothetical protein
MAVVLTLGPLIFTDFEVPESIPFGGEQMLVVKKLVGGARVIDAMGRDDTDISWSGRFRGANAETRAAEMDFLRVQGQQQLLSWSSRLFLVVVKAFKPDYRQSYEIPFSVTCTVIQDLATPILAVLPDADSAINADINQAGLLGTGINVAQITSAVAAVASSANAIAKFAGASPTQVAGVQSSIQTALGVVNSQQVIQNGAVASTGSVAGVVGGVAPQALAAQLSGQSAAFGQLGQLYQLQAMLARTSVNVTNAGQ